MVNNDRIVSVTKTDLLTLYKSIFTIASVTTTILEATTPGVFSVTSAATAILCAEPVKTLDIDATASSISSATIYFLAAHDFAGFTIDKTAADPAEGSVTVNGGSGELYKAVLATGAITITKLG
jgi:hypothetical protein